MVALGHARLLRLVTPRLSRLAFASMLFSVEYSSADGASSAIRRERVRRGKLKEGQLTNVYS